MTAPTLQRTLGFWSALVTGIGLVIASTTLTTLGNGFGLGGSAFAIAGLAALVITILISFSYSELANLIPGAGMIGDYTAPALGRGPAIFGVLAGYIVLVATVEPAELMVSGLAAHQLVPAIPPSLFAIGLTVLFCVINLVGVKSFGRTQLVVTGVMLFTLVGFGVAGLLELGNVPSVESIPLNPAGWTGIVHLVAIGAYLFIGIEFVCPMSEEIRNPGRIIPRAMISGLVLVYLVDMLFGFAALRYVGLEELATSATPHLLVAEAIAGPTGLFVLTAATILASASSVSAILAAVPRMLYGLARKEMLPRAFAWVHPRFRTPWISVLAVTGLIIGSLVTVADSDAVLTLVLVATVMWLASYILAQIDVIVLRRRYPDAHRAFRAPLYPLPQIIGIAACIGMIISIHPDADMRTTVWLGAAGCTAVILGYAFVWLKLVKKVPFFTPTPLADPDSADQDIREPARGVQS
ncbi:APC family permease [Haloactinomyces albus]|uniref:Amino acid transporter n=1 Tax=Haloactinomyces albus TaxID=1352928 RepID=A0AAE3ZET3_9ACTN|nr:APC family permease [Haloactinomyces albus]MDR7303587.1 amino acid transporter [Haloactinomyces albus]